MARAQSFATTTQPIEPGSGLLPRERHTRKLAALGKYRLLERVGRGSTGDVYRAEHVLLGRRVALKVLRDELARDEQQVERFFAEARAINLVGHRNVIEVTDFAREPDGTAWFVMELLEGSDLGSRLHEGRLPLRDALIIAEQLCAALSAVHAVGIVHHDVKPENVFVARLDGQDVVKLVDFGIARLPQDEQVEDDTFNGVVLGSPPYMAPEQACGMVTDLRADLYAVGALLFELVTGRPLFERPDTRALLEAVVFSAPPRASAYADLPGSVRDELDGLLQRCLAKQPTRRPPSAAALGAELAALRAKLDASMSTSLARKVPARVMALDESSGELAVAGSELLARCRPAWHKPALWLSAATVLLVGAAWVVPSAALPKLELRAMLPAATAPAASNPPTAETLPARPVATAPTAVPPAATATTAVPPAAPAVPPAAPATTAVPPAAPATTARAAQLSATPPPPVALPAPALALPAPALALPVVTARRAAPAEQDEATAPTPERVVTRRARERAPGNEAPRARIAPEPPAPAASAIPALSPARDPRPVLRVRALPEPPAPAAQVEPEAAPAAPARDRLEPGDDLNQSELLDPYADE